LGVSEAVSLSCSEIAVLTDGPASVSARVSDAWAVRRGWSSGAAEDWEGENKDPPSWAFLPEPLLWSISEMYH